MCVYLLCMTYILLLFLVIVSQKGEAWKFSFEVKFYPIDPTLLHEELTRCVIYLFNKQAYDAIQSCSGKHLKRRCMKRVRTVCSELCVHAACIAFTVARCIVKPRCRCFLQIPDLSTSPRRHLRWKVSKNFIS